MSSFKWWAFAVVGSLAAGVAGRSRRSDVRERAYFRGKNVIVTGGSRGLGFALTRRLLAASANVTICGRSAQTLATAAERLATGSTAPATFVCDVRSPAAVQALVRDAVARDGPVDILINNAGVIEVGPLEAQTTDDYHEAMDTHFWGPYHTVAAVLPEMRRRRSGQIVNVGSVGGTIGIPHLAPYVASKFAQAGWTQAISAELAPAGIAVTSVTPGLMITGSPEHAVFKGRHRAEYAWFTLSDANPMLATTADAAARRILRAVRRRDALVAIGWTATAARLCNAVLPQTTTRLLTVAARLLPSADRSAAGTRTGGDDSHSAWTDNPLTLLNTWAARENNQEPPPAHAPHA